MVVDRSRRERCFSCVFGLVYRYRIIRPWYSYAIDDEKTCACWIKEVEYE